MQSHAQAQQESVAALAGRLLASVQRGDADRPRMQLDDLLDDIADDRKPAADLRPAPLPVRVRAVAP